MADAQTEKVSSDDSAGCIGLLLGLAVIVFLFLGLETQRKLYGTLNVHPSIPSGKYSPIRVLSSTFEHHSFGEDKYVVTIRRIPAPVGTEPEEDSGFPTSGILYTAECVPHFWNLCADLTTGQDYYARWSSNDQKQIAVAQLQTGRTNTIDSKKVRMFEVLGWKKTED